MPDVVVSTAFTSQEKVTGAFNKMDKGAKRFGKSADDAFKKASKSGSRFGDVLKGILAADLVRQGLRAVKAGITGIIMEASKVEDALISFKVFTGSIEEAQSVVDELRETAAATPFQFENLAQAGKTLLGFEAVARQNLIPTLRMLGDTAGGNAERFDRITLAFAQIQAGGKASMQDINQLINAGVPILGAMAKQMGVTVGEMREMVAQGAATNDVVTAAFKDMTSEGGRFFNGMEEASKTFTGKLSTLKDNIKITASTLGLTLLPTLKLGTDELIGIAQGVNTWFIANEELINQKVGNFIEGVKETFRTLTPRIKKVWHFMAALFETLKPYKSLIPVIVGGFIAYNVALKTQMALISAKEFFLFVKTLRATAAAQGLLNVVMAANPLGAAIIGITALIGVLILLFENIESVRALMDETKGFWGNQFRELESTVEAKIKPIVEPITDSMESVAGSAIVAIESPMLNALKFFEKAGRTLGVDTRRLQEDIREIEEVRAVRAPNEAAIRQQMQTGVLRVKINMEGAPPGTTIEAESTEGAPPIQTEILGENP